MWQLIYENSPWPEKPKLSRNLVSATHSFLSVALLTARRGIKYELVVLNSVSYFIWDLIYMYKNKRLLAIIPARGGSKGIRLKNLRK